MTLLSNNTKSTSNITVVNQYGQTFAQKTKVFNMLDNYIYLYHTDTLLALPTFPESLNESTGINFSSVTPLARSAPIYTFSNAGPRTVQFNLEFHRDMMNEINTASSNLNVENIEDSDYVDYLINSLEAMALPAYSESEKMVDPPVIAIRFGNDIFCKGVVIGSVSKTYQGPILRTGKYALISVSFSVSEIDPYDAKSVMQTGSFRGLNTTLERRIWKKR